MSETHKYYYMRLKEDFFEDEGIKIMESMQDGYLYTNILLKMYLRSLKTEGRLMLNGLIPYDANMIAVLTGHQVGTVQRALEIFKTLHLIEVLDNGAIYMSDIQNFIGQTSTTADRQREYDRRIASEKKDTRNLTEILKKSSPEIEIEKDINKEIKRERKKFTPPTVEEVREYCKERKNKVDPERFVDFYASKGWMVGKNPMRDWKACVRTWEKRDSTESVPARKTTFHNFEQRETAGGSWDELEVYHPHSEQETNGGEESAEQKEFREMLEKMREGRRNGQHRTE